MSVNRHMPFWKYNKMTNLSIGQQARALLTDFYKKQEQLQKQYEDKMRPQCVLIANHHKSEIERLVLVVAAQGNHYIIYNKITEPCELNGWCAISSECVHLVLEELRQILDCQITTQMSGRIKISWKD